MLRELYKQQQQESSHLLFSLKLKYISSLATLMYVVCIPSLLFALPYKIHL